MKLPLILMLWAVVPALVGGLLSAKASQPPNTVLVELFTSEGCSSCPAADKLLSELAANQPIEGVRIIPLAFHVDYWNYLGWTDPFSSKLWTERQRGYARSEVYTPQMIVDGRDKFVGSDDARAGRSIESAAKQSKPRIELSAQPVEGKADEISIRITFPSQDVAGDVFLAVAEDGLETTVTRGENAGRRLRHDGVVRELKSIAALDGKAETFDKRQTIRVAEEWNRDNLRVVVFVQERDTRRIVAVAAAPIR